MKPPRTDREPAHCNAARIIPSFVTPLRPDEQLALAEALLEPARVTPRQRELGELMRGRR